MGTNVVYGGKRLIRAKPQGTVPGNSFLTAVSSNRLEAPITLPMFEKEAPSLINNSRASAATDVLCPHKGPAHRIKADSHQALF